MDTRWFKGCKTKAERDERKKKLMSYRNAFDALREMIEGDFEEAPPDYNNPSWSHKQADVNGANRKLKQILKIMEIK